MVIGLPQRKRNMTTYVIPAIKNLQAKARLLKAVSLIVQDVERSWLKEQIGVMEVNSMVVQTFPYAEEPGQSNL